MKANSTFATESRIALECMLDATASEGDERRALLKNARIAVGRAYAAVFSDAVDELRVVSGLDEILDGFEHH